jgi:cytochrome c-type biogenesis protein
VTESLAIAAGALWLGILTSISPCPLATNIAAVSYLGRRIDRPSRVLVTGGFYAAGRTAAYLGLGLLLVSSLLSTPATSHLLQKTLHKLMGPLLILVGMVLLELLRLRLPHRGPGGGVHERLADRGAWGAFALGALFALSFCPISAALFFGSLLPAAVEHRSPVLLPILYGVGTAAPVIVVAVIAAGGVRSWERFFGGVTRFELWGRRLTGVVFIAVGIYLTLTAIFGIGG